MSNMKAIVNRYILTAFQGGCISEDLAVKLLAKMNLNTKELVNDNGTLKLDKIEDDIKQIFEIYDKENKYEANYDELVKTIINMCKFINNYANYRIVILNKSGIMSEKVFPTRELNSNSYLLTSGDECVLIDPGIDESEVVRLITGENYKLKYILLTHNHEDHVGSALNIHKTTGAPIVLCNQEKFGTGVDKRLKKEEVSIFVEDGGVIEWKDKRIEVMLVPGHTSGSVFYKIDDFVFTGDTLLKKGFGMQNEESLDQTQMILNIRKVIEQFEKKVYIFPGHGEFGTLEEVIEQNDELK